MAWTKQTDRSNGVVYRQDANGAWWDILDKKVLQLDASDLDKPLDINDREIQTRPKIGPSTMQKQTSGGSCLMLECMSRSPLGPQE